MWLMKQYVREVNYIVSYLFQWKIYVVYTQKFIVSWKHQQARISQDDIMSSRL